MGTEFYIVDEAAKRVLDIHKSYWIIGTGYEPCDPSEILAAFDEAPEGGRCRTLRVRRAVESWLREHATGPVRVLNDAGDHSLPFERAYDSAVGYPECFRPVDGWECWTAFSWPAAVEAGWRLWLDDPTDQERATV